MAAHPSRPIERSTNPPLVFIAVMLAIAYCDAPDSNESGNPTSSSGDGGATTSTTNSTSSTATASSSGGNGGSSGTAGSGGNGGNGEGGATCDAPYADCDGLSVTVCETDTNTSIDHCGGCGIACKGAFDADPFCQAGSCILACFVDADNCDGDPSNGCEVDLEEDLTHCGACNNTCGSQHATPTCYDGGCLFACDTGFEDCNGLPADDCETNLLDDPKNCGSCAHTCMGGTCVAGTCQP